MLRVRNLQWLVLGIAYFCLGLLLRALTNPMGYGDSETYLQMAQHVGEFTISPHGYRILIPYLAAFLSNLTALPLPDTFLFLTLIAFVGVNLTLIIWFNQFLKLPLRTALLLSALYIFSYAGIYNLHNAIHVGFWEHWFLLLGFITIYHNRFWLLALFVFLSVWIKETIILLFPLYFVTAWRAKNFRTALGGILILATVFLGVFLFLRSGILLRGTTGISSYTNFYTPSYLELVMAGWQQINPLKEIYFAFQFLWLLAFLGWQYAPSKAKWMALLIPLALSQILLATDTQRMTVLAFPAILLLVSFLFTQLPFAAQFFLAVLNPLAFLLYNFHSPYLLRFSVFVLFCFGIWFACTRIVPRSFVVQLLNRFSFFRSESILWLAAALVLLGIIPLLTLASPLDTLGISFALAGTALGTLGHVTRTAGCFPLSPRM